jgi:hypothetical protein
MRSTIKTIILAATSAAIIASPAFAKTKRQAVEQDVPTAAQPYQVAPQSADTFGQIRDEYLKDAPSHNGNSY